MNLISKRKVCRISRQITISV